MVEPLSCKQAPNFDFVLIMHNIHIHVGYPIAKTQENQPPTKIRVYPRSTGNRSQTEGDILISFLHYTPIAGSLL
jgi:hypothetical protein